MALFGNYENSGSGIAKNAPQKKPFFRFWEIVGRKFWNLINVNLLMMASFLPLILGIVSVVYFGERNTQLALILAGICGLVFVVFFGPIIAGCTQILRNFSREKPCFLMDTFFKTMKSNFKQSMLLGWIDILVATSVASGMYIYPKMIDAIREAGEGFVHNNLCFVCSNAEYFDSGIIDELLWLFNDSFHGFEDERRAEKFIGIEFYRPEKECDNIGSLCGDCGSFCSTDVLFPANYGSVVAVRPDSICSVYHSIQLLSCHSEVCH